MATQICAASTCAEAEQRQPWSMLQAKHRPGWLVIWVGIVPV